MAELGGTKYLARQLSAASADERTAAAVAIGNMAVSPKLCSMVGSHPLDPISSLIAILQGAFSDSDHQLKREGECAAQALRNLSCRLDNKLRILEAGGITVALRVLSTFEPSACAAQSSLGANASASSGRETVADSVMSEVSTGVGWGAERDAGDGYVCREVSRGYDLDELLEAEEAEEGAAGGAPGAGAGVDNATGDAGGEEGGGGGGGSGGSDSRGGRVGGRGGAGRSTGGVPQLIIPKVRVSMAGDGRGDEGWNNHQLNEADWSEAWRNSSSEEPLMPTNPHRVRDAIRDR